MPILGFIIFYRWFNNTNPSPTCCVFAVRFSSCISSMRDDSIVSRFVQSATPRTLNPAAFPDPGLGAGVSLGFGRSPGFTFRSLSPAVTGWGVCVGTGVRVVSFSRPCSSNNEPSRLRFWRSAPDARVDLRIAAFTQPNTSNCNTIIPDYRELLQQQVPSPSSSMINVIKQIKYWLYNNFATRDINLGQLT